MLEKVPCLVCSLREASMMAEAKHGSICSGISTKSKAAGQVPSAWKSWASIRAGTLSHPMFLAGNCRGKRLASARYGSHLFKQAQQLNRIKAKVISFTDLAGHERYLRTTVFGLLSSSPNYCLLMVAANNGLIGMSKYGKSLLEVKTETYPKTENIWVSPSP